MKKKEEEQKDIFTFLLYKLISHIESFFIYLFIPPEKTHKQEALCRKLCWMTSNTISAIWQRFFCFNWFYKEIWNYAKLICSWGIPYMYKSSDSSTHFMILANFWWKSPILDIFANFWDFYPIVLFQQQVRFNNLIFDCIMMLYGLTKRPNSMELKETCFSVAWCLNLCNKSML